VDAKGKSIRAGVGGSLTVTTPTDRDVVMTRVFDAPRHLVYDAMTKPELLKQWLFGPDGWSFEVCEIDLRVGGGYRYVWRGPAGEVMGMRGVFREIVPPERVVQTERFDEPWYEGEAVGTLVLLEQKGQTQLQLTVRYASKAVRDAVLKTGMAGGVAAGYDRLAGLLTRPAAARE
jgi:uncharacterized protein YndB with AHSA1/START domain